MTLKRSINLLVLALGATGIACSSARAQSPPAVEVILRNMLRAEFDVTLEGEQVTVNKAGRALVQKVSKKPPHLLRVEVLSPLHRQGEVIVRNGRTQWRCRLRPQKVVVQQPAPPEEEFRPQRFKRHLVRLQRNFTTQYLGTDRVAGRSTYVIEIKPHNPRLPTRKVWVDTEKFVALKREQYAPDGSLLLSIRFERVNFNPTFTPDTFEFTPPSDAKVMQEEWNVVPRLSDLRTKAPFALGIPVYRPKGFQLDTAAVRVVTQNELPEIWLRYSDGLNGFSLFQRRLPPDAPPAHTLRRLQRQGSGVVWAQDGYQFTLIGALPEPELRKIAQSVRLQSRKERPTADR